MSIAVILFALAGCTPSTESSSNVTTKSALAAGNTAPLHAVQESVKSEVTAEAIVSDVIGRVVKVSELTGQGPDTDWTFEADEFRKVDILEKHMTEKGLTLVIFMTTRNNPAANEDSVQVSGKLQLQYERRGEQWILTTVENLTFSYTVGLPI